MDIGGTIKRLRSEKGLTQQKLAIELDMSIDMLRSIEINRAKPSIENLQKFSAFFEVSVDYLLGNVKEPTSVNLYPDKRKDAASAREMIDQYNEAFKGNLLPDSILIALEILSNHPIDLTNEETRKDLEKYVIMLKTYQEKDSE